MNAPISEASIRGSAPRYQREQEADASSDRQRRIMTWLMPRIGKS
jgi:hypothetical protein